MITTFSRIAGYFFSYSFLVIGNAKQESSGHRFLRDFSLTVGEGKVYSALPASCVHAWSVPGSLPVEITGWTIRGAVSLAEDPYFAEHPTGFSLACQVWRPVRVGWVDGKGWYQFVGANSFGVEDGFESQRSSQAWTA